MGNMFAFDVQGTRLSKGMLFSDFMVDGVKCGPDGARCDVDGNLWCSSNAGRAVGYNGVTVWNPQGRLIGRIRLPEVCANVSFGGPKRNRLFMVASQSLYSVHFNTQGASPVDKPTITGHRAAEAHETPWPVDVNDAYRFHWSRRDGASDGAPPARGWIPAWRICPTSGSGGTTTRRRRLFFLYRRRTRVAFRRGYHDGDSYLRCGGGAAWA